MQRLVLTPETFQQCIEQAAAVLKSGGSVLYPTETVYGLGVNAFDADAVSSLLTIKNRPVGKPVSVLVSNPVKACRIVEIDNTGMQSVNSLLPGPYTLVFNGSGLVDQRLLSETGTLGIRISSHPFAGQLSECVDFPITATSANASGAARPYSVDGALATFSERIRNKITLAIDAGELPKVEPSTVIDLTGTSQRYIRVGSAIPHTELYTVITAEEMTDLACQLTRSLLHGAEYHPIFFLLEGDLGAGKTQFTKGIALALGITSTVASPSYTLVKEYGVFPKRLVHMDLWRASDVTADEIGMEEYTVPGSIIAIEWPDPLKQWLAESVRYGLRVAIEGEGSRLVTVSPL